jgi:hypothetical protein
MRCQKKGELTIGVYAVLRMSHRAADRNTHLNVIG